MIGDVHSGGERLARRVEPDEVHGRGGVGVLERPREILEHLGGEDVQRRAIERDPRQRTLETRADERAHSALSAGRSRSSAPPIPPDTHSVASP